MKAKMFLYPLILLLCVLPALSGCGAIADKIGSEIGENILENASGGNVDMGDDKITIEDEDGNSAVFDSSGDQAWPEEFPAEIPEFEGKITATMKVEDGIYVSFEDAESDDVSDYMNKLKDKGFEAQIESTNEEGLAGYYVKDAVALAVSYTSADSVLAITYTKNE